MIPPKLELDRVDEMSNAARVIQREWERIDRAQRDLYKALDWRLAPQEEMRRAFDFSEQFRLMHEQMSFPHARVFEQAMASLRQVDLASQFRDTMGNFYRTFEKEQLRAFEEVAQAQKVLRGIEESIGQAIDAKVNLAATTLADLEKEIAKNSDAEDHTLRSASDSEPPVASASPVIELPPGSWMRALTRYFPAETQEHVFDSILADLRFEYFQALSRGASQKDLRSINLRHGVGFVGALGLELIALVWKVVKVLKGAS